MLEIRSDDLKNALITDIEYHKDTGELLTLWLRLSDKRLVSVRPRSDDSGLYIQSCPYDEKLHGNSTWVVTEKAPNGEFISIESSLLGAMVTYVGVLSKGTIYSLYMQLTDKRFIDISPVMHKLSAIELQPSLIEKYGGINYTGDLIRSRIQTPGDLAEVLVAYAKKWTKEGSLESIIRNSHMNNCRYMPNIPENQDLVDAAVVDFINYVAAQYCMDYGLYTKDLHVVKVTEKQCCFQCKHVPEWKGCELEYCHDDGMRSFPHVCSVNKCLVRAGELCDYFVRRDRK